MPKTGQPDFATIYISYIPDKKCVESKSLKLYLFSFRNHGDFHEDCVNIIMNDLIRVMEPRYIEVWGNLHRAAAFRLTRIATGVARERNTNKWRNIAY
ncbi:NADPH-dependent 7-cyano-7-deazaguanine reductase [Anoxybacillus sp. BCO1]|nr:NADPH-dependent 7-cyano-7-deazaguanine reductase [Anoxybacillus sp. BCO1]